MTDLIIVAIMVVLCGAAAGYIYKAKKSGAKCVGCPSGGCSGGCSCAQAQTGNRDCCGHVCKEDF